MKLVNKITKILEFRQRSSNSSDTALTTEEKKAIKLLRSYSNKDLADLGISRGEIQYVVKNGRSGIDNPENKKVA